MKAPEKIYVDSKAIGDNISTTVRTKPQDYPTCVEYIRTDAFIEKAEEFIYSALNDGIIGTANIEDFLRLFKNYMKGEGCDIEYVRKDVFIKRARKAMMALFTFPFMNKEEIDLNKDKIDIICDILEK